MTRKTRSQETQLGAPPRRPRSRQDHVRPTSEASKTEVEIRGRVPATGFAALAHPAAGYAELGGANSDSGQVRADSELIGAVIAKAANFRTEEHARAEDVIAEPAYGVIGVEGSRIRAQHIDERRWCGIDPQIALNLEASLAAQNSVVRIQRPQPMVLIVGTDRERNGTV